MDSVSVYQMMSNYEAAWKANESRPHGFDANAKILAEIVGNSRINQYVIDDFLTKKDIKPTGHLSKKSVVLAAFKARFNCDMQQFKNDIFQDQFNAPQTASELLKKIFFKHEDKQAKAWIPLNELPTLKNLSQVAKTPQGRSAIKEARAEIDPLQKICCLNLGLATHYAVDMHKAMALAKQIGGEAIKGNSGHYYIRIPVTVALDLAKQPNGAQPAQRIAPKANHKVVLPHANLGVQPGVQPGVQAVAVGNADAVIKEVLASVEKKFPYKGYGVSFAPASKSPAGMQPVVKGLSPNVGNIGKTYAWTHAPSDQVALPSFIQQPAVRLPLGMTATKYAEMRKAAQQGTMTGKGITEHQAKEFATALGGVVIEATLPYKAKDFVGTTSDVNVHCIFQSGLNFAGMAGGGIPVKPQGLTKSEIHSYTKKNAKAAFDSATNNGSDLLVFNIGIGAGFFAGTKKEAVMSANVDSLCEVALQAKASGNTLKCVVPDMPGFTAEQRSQLAKAGIDIVKGDKGAMAALAADKGLKVSETFAADPMSMLGIHAPGLWWETAGSASDEERAAFLTPCYALGHVPIAVHAPGQASTKIAALSEFMLI